MIFPCRIYDKNNVLKKEISAKELSNRHWNENHNPEYQKFSEAAYQSVRYAERKSVAMSDYIPTTDFNPAIQAHNAQKRMLNTESIQYNSMLKHGGS